MRLMRREKGVSLRARARRWALWLVAWPVLALGAAPAYQPPLPPAELVARAEKLTKEQQYAKASALLEPFLPWADAHLPPGDPLILATLRRLAITRSRLDKGSYASALPLYERLVAASRQFLGDKHPDTLEAACNLANAYQTLYRLDEALATYEMCVAFSRQVMGEAHPYTLLVTSGLAETLTSVGRIADAIPVHERITALVQEDLFIEKYKFYLLPEMVLASLADAYRDFGRHSDEVVVRKNILDRCLRRGGEDDSATIAAMERLSLAYKRLGKVNEALALQERVLATERRLLGEDHPRTLIAMSYLSETYRDIGRVAEALALDEQGLVASRRALGEGHTDTLSAMADLAATYQELGRTAEAVALEEKVLAERRRLYGEDHPHTLVAMASLAATYEELGRVPEALSLRQKVLSARQRRLGDEHLHTVVAMANLAETYRGLGRNTEAMQLMQKVLQLRRRQLGEDHPDTLTAMANLAAAYWSLGRISEALPSEERVLEVRRRLLGSYHPDTLAAMASLAATYEELGRVTEALQLKEGVLSARRQQLGEDHPATIAAVDALAATYAGLGRVADALPLQQDVLERRRRLLGEEHPATLAAMASLAGTYQGLGRAEDAVVLEERVLDVRRRLLGEGHPDTLSAMADLAVTYSGAMRRYADALSLEEAVLPARRRLLGEDHPATLTAMGNLAFTYFYLDRPLDGLALEERVLAARQRLLGESHPETLLAMGNVAATYRKVGRFSEALALQQRALAGRRQRLGERHPDTLLALSGLALTYAALDRIDEASHLLADYMVAVESLRADPALSADNRRSLFARFVEQYRLQARLLAALGRLPESFHVAELSKARTLLEATALERANRSGVLPSEEQARIDRLDLEAKGTEDALAKAGNKLQLKLQLEKRRDDLQRKYAALLADLKTRFPRYAQLADVAVLDASQGARVLPEGALFLSFLPVDKGWLLYALDRDGRLTVDLLPEHVVKRLEETVVRYREGLSRAGAGSGAPWRGLHVKKDISGEDDLQALAADLGAVLLGPVRERLGRYRQLIISPDGVLATLPFETLMLGGVPLVASHDVTYAQSLSVYALLQARGGEYAALHQRQPLFAMGNPVYKVAGLAVREAKAGAGEAALSAMVTRGGATGITQAYDYLQLQWDNLPGTARELSAVEQLFRTRSLQGGQATEAGLRELDRAGKLANYRYLLFSAHGYLSLQEPALSALVLSQDPKHRDAANDGYVSASEWPAYNLKSDLLVLSACETALGKQAQGEGIMGLPYALYVAGNKNTLLTLWQIDDAASAEFIERFFRKLKEGQDQVRALNETKREFLQDKHLSNPRFWAPFVMYGT